MRSSIGALVFAILFVPGFGRAETAPADAEKAPPTDSAPAAAKPVVAEPEPQPYVSHRELAGHVFIPSHLVLTPFSNTSFGMSLGGVTGSADGPANIKVDPVTGAITSSGTASYPYSAVGPALDLSIRLLEFLDLRLGMVAFLFSGISGPSALVIGSGFQAGGNVGVTAGLNLGEHVRAGFTFDVVSSPQYHLLVLQGISDAISSGQLPLPSDLLSKTNTLTVEPGLTAAWAPWDFIGGTMNFQYLHPSRTGSSTASLNGLTVAALVDFDLMKVVRAVPLGFTATYKWTTPIGDQGVPSSQDLVGGIFYTAHPDLALGLEIGEKIFHLPEQDAFKSSGVFFNISLQYYW